MLNKKQLETESKTLQSLQTIIESYEEIAAIRMRKVKKSVLQNRKFFSGLNDIYQRVMYTYSKTKESKKLESNKGPAFGNGKTISILISSNTGLYGDIVRKTYKLFVDNVTSTVTDVAILGRTGRFLFESTLASAGKKVNYEYFDLNDNVVEQDKLKAILEKILAYTNIVVYHGMYASILTQEATRTFVTGKVLDLQKEEYRAEFHCIFEPSIEQVAQFFERQIVASLFEQTVYESSLSKFASRMINLDFANDNIKKSVRKAKYMKLKFKHTQENINQLERIGSVIYGTKR